MQESKRCKAIFRIKYGEVLMYYSINIIERQTFCAFYYKYFQLYDVISFSIQIRYLKPVKPYLYRGDHI